MIWKESDLVDVSQPIKKLENTLIMDLQEEIALEVIRVFIDNPNTNLQIEFSCDGLKWNEIDKRLFEIQSRMVEIGISRKLKCRYIRILNASEYISYQCLIRKYPKIMLAALGGGWGDRMIAFLNAMYLARETGFKFGFRWGSREHEQYIKIPAQEKVFTQDFIEKYSYNNAKENFKNPYQFCQIPEFIGGYRVDNTIAYHYISHIILKNRIKDIPTDYMQSYKRLWREIDFLPHLKDIMQEAKNVFINNFQKKVIAIHLRSGDICYSKNREYYFNNNNKVIPIEIAIEIIKQNNTKQILLVGEDIEILENLKAFFEKMGTDLYSINEYVPSSLCDMERDLFELTFLSCCEEIYSYSGFARLASLIGNGKESINVMETFTNEEKFKMMSDNFNKVDTNPLYLALSLGLRFIYGNNFNQPTKVLEDILLQALSYDKDNRNYKIFLIAVYLQSSNYILAESMLKQNLSDTFIEYLVYMSRVNPIVRNSFNNITKFLPYTSFVNSKIYNSKNIFQEAMKYAKLAYEAEPQNEIFKDHLLKLLLEQPTPQSKATAKEVIKEKVIVKEKSTPSIYLVAKDRIHNHLAYKLGSAMILNSKRFLGYIRMPYVLSYIKEAHKKEIADYEAKVVKNPKLKLPKLESYADYKEALREKECFTYKLGLALMEADKTWYKGGYLRFFFQEIPKLRRALKEKRK